MELASEAAAALSRQFEGTPLDERLARGEPLTMEEVRAYLVARIVELLDRSPALLMSILYRIDVAEKDVKEALAHAGPAELPGRLADLVIQRQLTKIRLRRRYGDDA